MIKIACVDTMAMEATTFAMCLIIALAPLLHSGFLWLHCCSCAQDQILQREGKSIWDLFLPSHCGIHLLWNCYLYVYPARKTVQIK